MATTDRDTSPMMDDDGGRSNRCKEESDSDEGNFADEPDPFYDEGMDDEDEVWVTKNLRPHVSSRVQNKKESHASAQHHINSTDTKALGNTTKRARGKKQDCGGTLLSCPACFITLSMDCQQHEKYKNQWRAMFVSNCVTKLDESFEVSDPAPGEVYRPVACAGCGAVVAALEPREEVYHFFNVIPSSH